jgi:hypothetical protein
VASWIDPHSQMGRVLEALRQRPMSNIELMGELSIAHPPAVVRSLRRNGIRIDTEEHPNPVFPERKIKRYRLVAKG